jgi:hypothetical protein
MRYPRFALLGLLAALVLTTALVRLLAGAADAAGGTTTRVSVNSEGNGCAYTGTPAISGDGRYVAFQSLASILVPGDTNGRLDVFVHDRVTGTKERVSVDSAGNEANHNSWRPAMSGDGRFVAFMSVASNLAPGDTNGVTDIYLHDRVTGATEWVSVDDVGEQPPNREFGYPSVSDDGRFVAFQTNAGLVPEDWNWTSDIYVRDRQTGTITWVTVGTAATETSYAPALSGDGRFVAFYSYAGSLVPGDTNLAADIFVHDLSTGSTTRASVDSAGNQGNGPSSYAPAISADGRFVAFHSEASNLTAGDTNASDDIFVRDRDTDGDGMFDEPGEVSTVRVSVDSAGSQGNGDSFDPAMSADGHLVAFRSYASNLVPADSNDLPDIFLHDLLSGTTARVSVDSAGSDANGPSYFPAISGDGSSVAFYSTASNLVPGDTNGCADIFVHDTNVTPPPTPTPTPTPMPTPTPTPEPTPEPTPLDTDGDGFDDDLEGTLTWPPDDGGHPSGDETEAADQCDDISDDDGDTIVNDGCPEPGTGHVERCADTSAGNNENDDQWPADFNDDGRLNLQDVNSFNAPVRHFDEAPLSEHARWNLAGGADINLQDVNSLGTLAPPMFSGERAFGNTTYGTAGTCPAD